MTGVQAVLFLVVAVSALAVLFLLATRMAPSGRERGGQDRRSRTVSDNPTGKNA